MLHEQWRKELILRREQGRQQELRRELEEREVRRRWSSRPQPEEQVWRMRSQRLRLRVPLRLQRVLG